MAAQTDHPAFLQPADPEALIWRYMDFARFVSLMQHRALFFAPIRALAKLDRYEGTFNSATLNQDTKLRIEAGMDEKTAKEQAVKLRMFLNFIRKYTFVNCWHAASHESAAMWKLYGAYSEAICIVARYQVLADQMPPNCMIGQVRYIDFDREMIPVDNSYHPLMHKRIEYRHENEVRVVFDRLQSAPSGAGLLFVNDGYLVPIDPVATLEQVIISPHAPAWFADTVERFVASHTSGIFVSPSSLTSPVIDGLDEGS